MIACADCKHVFKPQQLSGNHPYYECMNVRANDIFDSYAGIFKANGYKHIEEVNVDGACEMFKSIHALDKKFTAINVEESIAERFSNYCKKKVLIQYSLLGKIITEYLDKQENENNREPHGGD